MGKGRKKRGPKSGDGVLLHAGDDSKDTAESFHGAASAQQLNSTAPAFYNAVKSNVGDFGAVPYSAYGTTFPGESSFSAMPKRTSSDPCRHFQRGFCWNGDTCRFQHSEGASTAPPTRAPAPPNPKHAPAPRNPMHAPAPPNPKHAPAPPNPTPAPAHSNSTRKAFFKKERAPQDCLDWYLTGSCPRYRTCRYAHPSNMGMNEESFDNHGKASGKGLGSFDFMAEQLLRHGLCGSSGGGGKFGKQTEERMRNGGFTDDDVYELSLQGIKPWDPEAMDALAVLKGYDMEDYDDYYDDELGFY